MKKLFKDKKLTRKGILEFLDKRGFYIVLILCIAIVGATAVFVTTHNITSSNEDFDMNNIVTDEFKEDFGDEDLEADVEIPDGEEVAIGTSLSTSDEDTAEVEVSQTENMDNTAEEDKPKDEEKETNAKETEPKQEQESQPKADKPASTTETNAEKDEPKKEQTASKKDSSSAGDKKFVLPVIGEISFDYAMDRLVYSKTLEDWRTHSGIDLAADRGTNVKAAADGFVSEIKKDPRFGITIIIDHQNGLKTVYSNLASDEVVSPNQKVKQGDVIGAVGNTALFESAEQSHLHFEVLKDNRPVDPKEYLPLKK